MLTTNQERELKPGHDTKEIMFQEMGGLWYAFLVDNETNEPLFAPLPPGIYPGDKNFCFIRLFNDQII